MVGEEELQGEVEEEVDKKVGTRVLLLYLLMLEPSGVRRVVFWCPIKTEVVVLVQGILSRVPHGACFFAPQWHVI